MTIHSSHPFPSEPDPVRRLRGRLAASVTLWTAGEGADRAGLTVTSMMVANGEPARLLALVDPDSELADAVEETGRAVVQLLGWADRGLADAFAGLTPAPGGPFRMAEFEATAWGPRLAAAGTWAGVALESAGEVGWSRLLTCVVEHVEVAELPEDAEADEGAPGPLLHHRGRYHRWPG